MNKKKKKDRQKDKSREFLLMLYPDNPKHAFLILALTADNSTYQSVGLLHDKDINLDTGELKKAHWHFYIRFVNPRYITGVAKELDIEPHLIDFVESNFIENVKYFLHWNNPEKAQYNIDDLKGNLANLAKIKISELTVPVEMQCAELFNFINSFSGFCSYSTLYNYSLSLGYEKAVRRNVYHFKALLDAHNYPNS